MRVKWRHTKNAVAIFAKEMRGRTKKSRQKSTLCVTLCHSEGVGSLLLKVDHTQVYQWIRVELPEPGIHCDIREIEFDEIWYAIITIHRFDSLYISERSQKTFAKKRQIESLNPPP
jgi:hypothetical protein